MEITTEPITKTYPNVAQSFGIAGIVIAASLLLIPINFGLREMLGDDAATLSYYVLAMGIAFWIVNTIRARITGEDSFVVAVDNARMIPLIILTTLALLFGIISPLSTLIPMPEVLKEMFRNMASQTSVFAFIMLVVAAPVFEELIFRGIMLEGLLKQYTPLKSIVISSLLFGLVHLNPWQFITGFVIGIFSGWVYYRTRSLMPSIIIHAAANLTAFLVRLLIAGDDSVFDQTVFDMYGGLTNLFAVIVGSIIVIAVCVQLLSKGFEKETAERARESM